MHPSIWDRRADFYKDTFLTPFADEMVATGPDGNCRNLLLNRIKSSNMDFDEMRIADFGCGPGNLLEHLEGRITRIDGIDLSQRSLHIASTKALARGIRFKTIDADMATWRSPDKYDLIFSVNSILPPDRETVNAMFRSIRENLTDTGEFWGILPSFDTTEHIWRCTAEQLEAEYGSAQAHSRLLQIMADKKVDEEILGYADDGVYIQCFHTPDSLAAELNEAGLVLIEPLRKLYYPWELSKRFDYGYFPEKEEIWDWFVVAQPKAS